MQSEYKADECVHGTVMALGNFDGIHRGHRAIIEKTVGQSRELGTQSSVLLLNPHPLQYLKKERKPFLLTTLQDKCTMFKDLGIQCIFMETFDEGFASLPPRTFVERYLVDRYRVQGVVVGFDYTFGRRGEGDTCQLQKLGAQNGFRVTVRKAVTLNGQVISSSLIRGKIGQGLVDEASLYLGYPYHIQGRVIPGTRLGRTLGVPTANLQVDPFILLPKRGVYVGRARCLGRSYYALANIGFKPTVSGQNLTVEVHILDFCGDIYGEELIVTFLHRMRDEMVFGNTDELRRQILRDIRLGQDIIRRKYSENAVM